MPFPVVGDCPEMLDHRYDLVVIGGGAAGLVGALVAAGLGVRVVLVEAAEHPGGDCLHTGCVPSKSLLAAAQRAHDIRHAHELGVLADEPEVDFPAVMAHVRRAIARAGQRDAPERLEAQGVEVLQATARFEAPGVVSVGGRSLGFRAALIATGARPAVAPVAGISDAEPLTSETVWDLDALPPRLAILGAGPVGVELGQAFARLGSAVTLVEAADRPLAEEEPEAGDLLARLLVEEGVELRVGAPVERVEPRGGGGGRLVLEGDDSPVEFDRLLCATGRTPTTQGLGLESVGVALSPGGHVRVDRCLRTTGERIWAAGDVTGQLGFTHVAGYHGALAALNALLRLRRRTDLRSVPRVTFTAPEIAAVGLTEAQARARLRSEPVVLRHDYSESDRAIAHGGLPGFAKLVTTRRGRIVGATIAAPAAGETVAEVAAMVHRGDRASALARRVHAYPTFAEGPVRAAGEWTRRRATPQARRRLAPVLRLLGTAGR